MKKFISFFIFCSIAVTIFSQEKEIREPYLVKNISESFSAAEVRTSGGNITVSVGSPVRVEVFVSGISSKDKLSKEEIKQRLSELYELEIAVAGNKLIVYAKPKEQILDWKKTLNISFQITVPEKLSSELETSGGNITVSEINGVQNLSTSGGNIKLEHTSGKIIGRTSGGNIYVTHVKDNVDVSTSGGNIIADHSTGTLKLKTSGGDVLMKALNGDVIAETSGGNVEGEDIAGSLRAQTSGGNVRLEALSCSLDASTSGGNIRISITKLVDFVRINNSAGSVDLALPQNTGMDLDLSGRIKDTDLHGFEGSIKDDAVKGKLKGGGVPVTVDAGEGRVTLRFK
jgi:DUF4097 and DUF4098 domain-containing protein YvlB